MQFDPKYRPELCVSKYAARAGITSVYLDVKGKRLIATDGHTLTITPCEVEAEDVSGLISVEVLKAARKFNKHLPGLKALAKTLVLGDGASFPRPEGEFPQVDQVIPNASAGDVDTFEVAFDPSLMLAVAKSIGCEVGVRVVFDAARLTKEGREGELRNGPALVFAPGGNREGFAFGVCMPRSGGRGIGGEAPAPMPVPAPFVRNGDADDKAIAALKARIVELEHDVSDLRAELETAVKAADAAEIEAEEARSVASKAEDAAEEAKGTLEDGGQLDALAAYQEAVADLPRGMAAGRVAAAAFAVRVAYSQADELPPKLG